MPLADGLSAQHALVRPDVARPHVGDVSWQRRYQLSLVIVDASLILLASFFARFLRFGEGAATFDGYAYDTLAVALAAGWVASLALCRAYEMRFLGSGSEEYKRVTAACVRLAAVIASVAYIAQLQLARGFVAIALPLGAALLLVGRYAVRRRLHSVRARGYCLHRVLALGSPESIEELVDQLRRSPYAGFTVVGGCAPVGANATRTSVPIYGDVADVNDVLAALTRTGADTVAVTSGPGITPTLLRRLSWNLEDTDIDLVVAPALTDVAGPRINIRPVAGLPLLHVEQPELDGFRQTMKLAIERVLATLTLVVALPLIALLCLVIRIESPGAPIFRQTRVGRHGKEFTVYKLRTMRADAESLLAALDPYNNQDRSGPLFKMRKDPRITRVGAVLRKWSLDELPQLWNVVRGDMAIVGPRPPLPSEVARYHVDAHRRLLVRPGITGLWQVSGRADLSWDDTVRLDLYYVENWSLAMDMMIIWKTIFAVIRRHGAY